MCSYVNVNCHDVLECWCPFLFGEPSFFLFLSCFHRLNFLLLLIKFRYQFKVLLISSLYMYISFPVCNYVFFLLTWSQNVLRVFMTFSLVKLESYKTWTKFRKLKFYIPNSYHKIWAHSLEILNPFKKEINCFQWRGEKRWNSQILDCFFNKRI
jgi:hypothetical protein